MTLTAEQEQKFKFRARLEAEADAQIPEQEDGFLARSGDTLSKGFSDAGDSLSKSVAIPDALPDGSVVPSTGIQSGLRKALGLDIIPAVGGVVGDTVMTGAKEILPDSWQKNIAGAAEYVMDSAPVEAVGDALGDVAEVSGLNAFEQEMPEAYAAAEDFANIATAVTPFKRPNLLPDVNMGKKSRAGLTQYNAQQRRKGISDNLEPDDIINARGAVTEEGLLNTSRYNPTKVEQRMYAEVDIVPDVDPTRSSTHNMNALESKVETLRRGLDDSLDGAPAVKITDVAADIEKALADIELNPTLVGDAGKVAERVYTQFGKIVDGYADKTGGISPKDLLQARRDLDAWLRDNSSNIFDAGTSARKVAVTSLRRNINQRVNDSVPSAQVTKSLRKQSDLLTARDIYSDKAVKEGRSGLSRAVDKVERETGLGAPRTPLAAQANIGSLTAMGLTGLGTAASLGRRGLNNATRAAATKTLEGIETVINSGGKITAKMQADRLAAIAVLNREDNQESK